MNNDRKFTKADFKHIDFHRDPKLAALFGFGEPSERGGRAGGGDEPDELDGTDEPAAPKNVEVNIEVGNDHIAPCDHRQRLADILKAAANVERLNIIELLAESELSVSAIEDQMSVNQPSISRHLNYLHRAGLVEWRAESQTHFYRLIHPELPEKLAAIARTVLK